MRPAHSHSNVHFVSSLSTRTHRDILYSERAHIVDTGADEAGRGCNKNTSTDPTQSSRNEGRFGVWVRYATCLSVRNAAPGKSSVSLRSSSSSRSSTRFATTRSLHYDFMPMPGLPPPPSPSRLYATFFFASPI